MSKANQNQTAAEVIEHEDTDESAADKQVAELQTGRELQTGTTAAPLEMLGKLIAQGASVETVQQMMDLSDRYQANEARQAFLKARSEWKRNPPTVVNDMTNDQYGSSYSSLANLVGPVNESMAPYGLTADWEYDQSDPSKISVTCILSHEMGHIKKVTLSGPPDDSGKKNDLQKIRSTLTYLKLATFEGVTGIASKSGNCDDDGGDGAGDSYERISEDQIKEIQALLDDTHTDQAKFLEWCEVDSLEDIPSYNFKPCIDNLKRKKKLQEKQAESA